MAADFKDTPERSVKADGTMLRPNLFARLVRSLVKTESPLL